jgi:DMSO/TMAO reductase YedYZ molybdopterin-dependent catalytic subunit
MGEPATSAPRWVGVLIGLVAAAAGLAAAGLLTGLTDSLPSPVVVVGDRVVDDVPRPVKDWAIATFGTDDKVVLLAGVVLLLAVGAACVGIVAARRSRRSALLGVAAFSAIGVASSFGRGRGGWASPVPSLVAGAIAAGALVLLVRRSALAWPPPPQATAAEAPGEEALADGDADVKPASARMAPTSGAGSRRRFLALTAGAGAAAVLAGGVGRWLAERSAVVQERLRIKLPAPAEPLPAVPADVAVDAPGAVPFITPTTDLYRIDTALVVPRVSTEDWTLTVKGRVRRPLTLTYRQLLDRPMHEVDITISCVSNEVGGKLIGTARWLGCRLDDLLHEAGIQPSADQIVGRSVDGFTAGFPTALLDGRDALVAIGMNGEALPIEHGYPARLIVPGVYGYVSATKWLSEIELTRFDDFEAYWNQRGWSELGPVKTGSRIDTPHHGDVLRAGRRIAIAGVAWAMNRSITRVEVGIGDPGDEVEALDWGDATLAAEHSSTTWRQWVRQWTPEVGDHAIAVRATDSDGAVQTSRRAGPAPDGATGWHRIDVRAR